MGLAAATGRKGGIVRVVLVSLHPYPSPQAIPLANAFLQGFLDAAVPDCNVDVVRADFFLQQEIEYCAEQIISLQPDAIGFSLYVWNRSFCRELVTKLRNQLPDTVIFAGGPEATADPHGVLADSDLHFLISGEGEKTFAAVCTRLADGQDLAMLPGVVTRTNGGITLIPAQPILNLDEIPSPWLNKLIDIKEYPGILWQISRGCGFSCDFCFDSRGEHGVRRFSLERIEAELRYFALHGVSQVFVLDSTFNQDLQRAKKILRLIKKIAPDIHFHFEVRNEFIDRELAQLFAEITCSLQIGLQSADPQVLKEVGRVFRRDDFVTRTMLLNESGAVFGFDLMYGLPGDSLEGFRKSLDFALELYPNHLDIFPLAILPGTALAARADSIGLRHLPQPPYTLISSPGFSSPDMASAQKLAGACDIFYTRGRAVAWFNGMLHVLGQRPSDFLQRFSDWLVQQRGERISEADLNDDQIWELQRTFLTNLFATKRLKRFLPALLDLVDYHFHYAAALMSPAPGAAEKIPSRKQLQKSRPHLAPTTRLALFHYEILEILEAGVVDIQGFSDGLQQCGSWAVIYPTIEGVFTESISESYYTLLKHLDGAKVAGDIVAHVGIPFDEAAEFLEFALSEGIISIC
jgi:hypothetical protein